MLRKSLALLIVAILALSLFGAPLSASAHTSSSDVPSVIDNNGRGNRVHITGKVIIHDISVSEVFAFASDFHNDIYWYPGVISSELISGDGGRGSVYEEELAIFGEVFLIRVDVLHVVQNKMVRFRSNGVLINDTIYRFRQMPDGNVEFIVDSFVELPPGVDVSFIHQYTQATLSLLLVALNRTGEIIIPAHGNQQS